MAYPQPRGIDNTYCRPNVASCLVDELIGITPLLAKPQSSKRFALKSNERDLTMAESIVFERAPDRTIWAALVELADDSRLHSLHIEADRMIINQRNSGLTSARSLGEGTEWSDFSTVIKNEENRRE
jgi:hypothetical protein